MLLPFFLPAARAEAPDYAWTPGEKLRYHVELKVAVPTGVHIFASRNTDARVGIVEVIADTECTPAAVGKNTELTCTFAYLKFTGEAWPSEQARADRILAEWTERLAASSVQLFMSPDGRLKEFDLKTQAQRDSREGDVIDAQRSWLKRAFAVFDLPLTNDDKDWIRGWNQTGMVPVFDLISPSGTVASVEYKHKFAGERDGYSIIESGGRGTVSKGGAVDASSGSSLIDARVAGEALFDVANGDLVYRALSMDGRYTASSVEVGNDAAIQLYSAMQRVEKFEPEGAAPLPISAQKAIVRDVPPPELPAGVELLNFDVLGMQALFINGQPDNATLLDLPTASVQARVFVDADGIVTGVTAFKGYEVLLQTTEKGLKASRFPAKGKAYAVDVSVEIRK